MDDDLTASHWDDVLSPSQQDQPPRPLNSFYSLSLEDPHTDSYLDPPQDASDNDAESHEDHRPFHERFLAQPIGQPQLNDDEAEQLDELQRAQREVHKSTLLQELTESGDTGDLAESLTARKVEPVGDSLFGEQGSPLKLGLPSTPPNIKSPSKATSVKEKLRAQRLRRFPVNGTLKHMADATPLDSGPLGADPLGRKASENQDEAPAPAMDMSKKLALEADSPLYALAKPDLAQEIPLQNDLPKESPVETQSSSDNNLHITVGDPAKVGDITTAHIVYEIKSVNKNPQSAHFPETTEPFVVSRRYKDFRWIYHQLQNNHPGYIIPPPPLKQTYIGRFNENFIENRRMTLEKMLNKISKIPVLGNDPDFVLFLTSSDFANESKAREQAAGSSASLYASKGDDESETPTVLTGATATGFMSSLFSMSTKHDEPRDDFSKKKAYLEDLEHNLRTFHKSLELIACQRLEIIAVTDDIAGSLEELADLEILKGTTDLLAAFAEVHLKLKENLDRVNLQDQLTLGFTIEEYLRIIGSAKHVFEARSKIYQHLQTTNQDLSRKEESLERLNSRSKSSTDKINQLNFEVLKLKQKATYFQTSFDSISETIKSEIDKFEFQKMEDFRNSVEIFIENSIESQKEAIELWETFYERQGLSQV